MELVDSVLWYSACIGIDHEPSLAIRPGLQTSLNRSTQSNVFWVQNVVKVLLPKVIVLIDFESIVVAGETGFHGTAHQLI